MNKHKGVFLLLSLLVTSWVLGEETPEPLSALHDYAQQQHLLITPAFERYCQQGLLYWRQQNFVRAAEEFGRAALHCPTHPWPQLYFALALAAQKRYDLAGRMLRRCIHLYPYWHKFNCDLGRVFPGWEFVRKLRQDITHIALQTPQQPDVGLLLGFLYQYGQGRKRAAAIYRLILQHHPDYQAARILLASLARNTSTALSESAAKQACQRLPWGRQAQEALKRGLYQEAADLSASAYVHTRKIVHLYTMIHAFLALQRYRLAAATLEYVLQQGPLQLPGNLREQYGPARFDEHLQALESKVEQQADKAPLLFVLAYLYLSLGEQSKAHLAVQAALAIQPDHQGIQRLLPYTRKRKDVAAVENKAHEQAALVKLAKKYFRQQAYKQALRAFAQACLKDPADLEAKAGLLIAAFAMGEYHYAAKALRQLIEQGGYQQVERPWRHYYAQDDFFAVHYQKLVAWLKKHPQDTQAMWLAAVFLMTQGDYQQARHFWKRICELNPQDEHARHYWQQASSAGDSQ